MLGCLENNDVINIARVSINRRQQAAAPRAPPSVFSSRISVATGGFDRPGSERRRQLARQIALPTSRRS